jgi:hypothetical protein
MTVTPASPWLVPDWPAPPQVRALFTTRGLSTADGASAAPFEHFNLGDHVGDLPQAVDTNRARLAHALRGARPVFMKQVHGTVVLALTAPGAHPSASAQDVATADAAVSAAPGLACTVMVADCLPVLLTNRTGTAIAAAHAGWRGLASGVLQSTLASFRAAAQMECARQAINIEASEVLAWLGPCIGPRAFEVGPEVRKAFIASDAGASACFASHGTGKYLADLPGLARRVLAAHGVSQIYGNDSSDNWCTVAQPALFYSYRRDQAVRGATGRMAACIWLEAAPTEPGQTS